MIEIKNLNKIYSSNKEEITVLKDINLKVKKNSLFILKGVSGSGKSTLLSIIGAILKPTSGEVRVGGELISKLPDFYASKFRNEHIGFIFQSFNLINDFSVYENITAPLIPQNLSFKEIEKKSLKALKLAKIEHKKEQLAKHLSGGEKQRVAIARALVNEPLVILADEPTANLDRENSLNFISILKELKEAGNTIVVATHDNIFDEVEFVDKVIYIKEGEIIN